MKKNKDILSEPIFNLPKNRDSDGFIDCIEKIFKELSIKLKSLNGELADLLAPNYSMLDEQCETIIRALTVYYKGYPHKSYLILKECLDGLKTQGLLPIQDTNVTEGLDEYFRIRSGLSKYKKKDLFHIPFQLREKVSTQRYSIPGLPCLYLGDSIYVCWEELNRPDINQLNVSRFDMDGSKFRFLFFNETMDDYIKRCFHGNQDGKPELLPGLASFLSYFPLLMVCSFKVAKPNEVFKPEYIIPQLLLQWIVGEQDLDGIKYRSNRINNSKNVAGTFANMAIPVKTLKNEGFCTNLSSRISFTEPVSWQAIEISNEAKKLKLSVDEIARSTRRVRKIELIEGQSTDYFNTKFGKFEEKLRTLPVNFLK